MKKTTVWLILFFLMFGLWMLFTEFKKSAADNKPQKDSVSETVPMITREEPAQEEESSLPSQPEQMPDSVLYYGEILEIKTDEAGEIAGLRMDSQRYGPYIMKLTDRTVFIDSGERKAFDPEDLSQGDRIYVFISPVSFRSMPPQSEAFALINHVPMDAGCAMYHEVEAVENRDGSYRITTDNGNKTLAADADTEIFSNTGEKLQPEDLTEGSFLMAWYWDRGEEILRSSHMMLLP